MRKHKNSIMGDIRCFRGGSDDKPEKPAPASTTSTNPYATGKADGNGSSYTLNPFLTGQNAMVEQAIPTLYNQLMNPSLDNPVTKARSDAFYRQFNEDSNKQFENNLINPLAKRNLLRSSAVTDLSKAFANDQTRQVADFNSQQISNNTVDTQALIQNLLNQYLMGANLGQQAVANAKGDAQQINGFNSGIFGTESSMYNTKLQSDAAVSAARWQALGSALGSAGGATSGGGAA